MTILSQTSKKRLSIIAYTGFIFLALILASPNFAFADSIFNSTGDCNSSDQLQVTTAEGNGIGTYQWYSGNVGDISTPVGGSWSYLGNTTYTIHGALTPTTLGNYYTFMTSYGYWDLVKRTDGGCESSFNATYALGYTLISWGYNATGTPVVIGGAGVPQLTSIVSVTPANGTTIATSTTATIGADVYISPSQYNSSEYVEIAFIRNQDLQSTGGSPALLTTTFDFPVASGVNIVSTTTDLETTGQYNMTTSLKQTSLTESILNFFGFGQVGNLFDNSTLIATSTTFIVGAPTAYDIFEASTTNSINDFIASSSIPVSACDPISGSFSLTGCMGLLFTWQTAPMNAEMTTLQKTLFSYAPWGYVTRTMTILTSGATTTIPAISFTFPADYPVPFFAGFSLNFNPWQYFTFYQNFKSDPSTGSAEDAWQIMAPLFTSFCWLWTAWLIFSDLLKLSKGSPEHEHNNLNV